MQTRNPFLDQIGRLMTDAAGAAQGVREEVDTLVRRQVERFIADMDLVSREEFDVAKELAAVARSDAEALRAEVAELRLEIARLSIGPVSEGSSRPSPPRPTASPARKRGGPGGARPRRPETAGRAS
ncbi:MAG: accessory factor UbiK family protein [Pseudomonadota bacterium]